MKANSLVTLSRLSICLLLAFLMPALSQLKAQIAHDESVHGEISDDFTIPNRNHFSGS